MRSSLRSDAVTREPVRVAVLVECLTVPAWVEWTVARIDATEGLELVAVVPAEAGPKRSSRSFAYRLYEWADRKAFGPSAAMRDADLSPLSSGRAAADGLGPLDVVVSFLPAERTTWEGSAPRHGVWAIAPMDDGRPGGAPSRFWELRDRNGTATTAVVALDGDARRLVAQGSARADPLSLTRTRASAAWASARLVLRCLRLLERKPALPREHAHTQPPGSPPATITIAHAARTAIRGIAAKSRKASLRDEWFVAVRPRTGAGRARPPLRALENPGGRYLADPFPIEVGGRHFLFVEDYSKADGRGSISVLEAGSSDDWSPPRRVLQREHHLSYPFVFEHEGEIYMLPETMEAGRVELYRAVDFPNEWRLERVLLDGLTAVDPTLHIEDGAHWLFVNVLDGPEDRGELWLFSARSLDGEWQPHPHNPIVTDPGSARPAGRLFRRGRALLRPSQDGMRGYGRAIVLNRVDAMSPSEYCETPVERIEPDWSPGVEGTHTYTFDSRYECLDGYRHVRRLAGWRRPWNGRP